jgi:hypothetical protein
MLYYLYITTSVSQRKRTRTTPSGSPDLGSFPPSYLHISYWCLDLSVVTANLPLPNHQVN